VAPAPLTERFALVAPYAAGVPSFYDEPRRKVLAFVDWACSDAGRAAGCPDCDPRRVFLFGFSDGATVGIELMTTRRFAGGVFAAYGFTGELPPLALARLKDAPIWMFHSADDVIFPVSCSDRLVAALRRASSRDDVVRYTRYDRDQEGFTGAVQGHSTGITASRQPAIYEWLLSIAPPSEVS
jgi:predicted peptidase